MDYRLHLVRFTYRPLPNISCHLPLLPVFLSGPPEATGVWGATSSSTVSRMVEMAAMPWSEVVGERRMTEFEVFFWRREYVLSGVLRRADVSEDSSVRLERLMSTYMG